MGAIGLDQQLDSTSPLKYHIFWRGGECGRYSNREHITATAVATPTSLTKSATTLIIENDLLTINTC